MNRVYSILEKYPLVISIFILTICFILFFPKTYATVDEHDYLHNSINIIENSLKQKCNGESSQFKVESYCIYKYNIGTSILLIPSVLISKSFAFFTTFLAFILSIFIFYKLLKLLNIPTIFLYLFSFYPSFVYYSRTLLSEIYSLLFFICLLYLAIKLFESHRFVIGTALGTSFSFLVLIRYTNIVPALFLLGAVFLLNLKQEKNIKKSVISFFSILIGAIPLIALMLVFNNYLYNHPFRSGYYYSNEELVVSTVSIPSLLIKYFLLLNVVYPGMFTIFLFSKFKQQLALKVSFLSVFIFYTLVGEKIIIEGRLLDLIIGTRFFVPFIPLLLISNFSFLKKYIKARLFRIFIVFSVLMLLVNTFILSAVHQKFLFSLV